MKYKINKKMNLERKIVLLEGIFILSIFVYLFFSMSPNQVYPIHGMVVSEPTFNLEIENGEEVLISSVEDFENPIVLQEGDEISLLPGTYYWKARSKFRESEIKSFIIESNVGLDIKKRNESYELQNSGNVDLNVTTKKPGMTSRMTLDVGESTKIENDSSIYQGEQK